MDAGSQVPVDIITSFKELMLMHFINMGPFHTNTNGLKSHIACFITFPVLLQQGDTAILSIWSSINMHIEVNGEDI